ncbi:cation transporter [Candidatus Woesearchaeota archaeon]|nr:cation transporter [Candidatus Woesearchaeota archaeon]
MERNDEGKALGLSYFTVGYNIVEGIVSVFFGSISGSIALVGFGLDSFIESLSGSIMIWRFKKREYSKQDIERIEKKALQLVGYTFFVLALYVLYESLTRLYFAEASSPSLAGIIITIISLIIMPILYHKKHRLGHQLHSRSLIADSKQTIACMLLSVAVLLGIALNWLFGFWQADPIAGLVVSLLLMREGYLVVRNKELCRC